jgi:hypothetical protein
MAERPNVVCFQVGNLGFGELGCYVAGRGMGGVGSGWTVLGGELAVPCTRNPL